MDKLLPNLAALEAEAVEFARALRPRASGATLVTLSGELGAGKTAFVKAAAKALGVEESVTSPTFVLLKTYDLNPKATPSQGVAFRRFIHIDAYRLKSGAELAPLHFDETLKQADNLIMLEWPEMVSDALPAPAVRITLEALPDGSRRITYA